MMCMKNSRRLSGRRSSLFDKMHVTSTQLLISLFKNDVPATFYYLPKGIKGNVMKLRLFCSIIIISWLNLFQAANAGVIDDNSPNPLVVGKAFGFMLFGNDGFMNPHIYNLSVDGCKVSYETGGGIYSHAIQKIYISYDLNKANWRSAVYQPDYVNDIVNFVIFGETGLREVRYDHTFNNEEELRIGIAFLGLTSGLQSDIRIQLPNYMTQERFDRAFWDLVEQCPGTQGGY